LTTADYIVVVHPVSIRFHEDVHARLRRAAAERGDAVSALAARLVDEGLRMLDHPGIVFRDGPTGRRAGLANGPDVWEVASGFRFTEGSEEERITATATSMGLGPHEVRRALRYWAEFTDEIDARVAANDAAADEELAAWKRQQRLLAR
jgi:hypothetical protein